MYGLPKDFAERLRAGLALWAQTSLRLADNGWTAPRSLTPKEVYDLLEPCSTPEEIDAAYVQLFLADKSALFEHTASFLLVSPTACAWRDLLTEVFECYRRGEYLVAVPALLVVLEGILAADAGRRTKVTAMVEERVRDVEARLPESLTLGEWKATARFFDRLFKTSPFDADPPGNLNRHWVLHGRDSADWTQADCLRLIVAIETVSSLLDPSPG